MRDLDVPLALPDRLWPALLFFLKRHLRGMLLLFALPITGALITASYGNATRHITDAVLDAEKRGGDLKAAAVGPLVHFILLVASTLLVRSLQWTVSYRNKMPYMADVRRTIFSYVQRHDTGYFEANLSGKVAHKAATLPDQLRNITERCCFELFPGVAFFLVSMVYFATARPIFVLLVAGWLAVYFGSIALLGKGAARASSHHNEAKTQLTGRVVDMITNIKSVIANAAHAEEDRVLAVAVDETRRRHGRSYLATVRIRFVQQLLNIAMWIMLYGAAIFYWVHRAITAGDFVMIAQLGGQLINRAQDVGDMLPDFIDDVGAAAESIETLVVARTLLDAPDARPLEVKRGAIAFDRIAFAYPNGPPIFRDFSLRIEPGQRVGLVGASGAGKSTLAALLLRLHDVERGSISIDGQDLRSVTQASLRGQIALIPQDTTLFYRTLLENIRYGRPSASDAEVIEAAQQAHADEFIDGLPERYGTLVGERGVKLSGGQRQRIAIARALLKRAPILILDEATSALDSESESLIQRAMEQAMQGRTVLAIAHRLSTIAHLDRLIVLADGQVIEDGSHPELLERGGLYARLWRRQSEGFLREDDDGDALFAEPAATLDP